MRHKKDIITKENQNIFKMWSNKNSMMKIFEEAVVVNVNRKKSRMLRRFWLKTRKQPK